MWILPKTLEPSLAFVADTLESSEDLSLPELQLEHSLMWRSKPSPVQTWLRRWKREKWFRHLCGRILKPSQHKSFETELTLLLADIPVNRLAQRESDLERMTPDISGPSSESICEQFDLLDVSLKTSRDTSASAFKKSSKTWKALVILRRGEYSARLKSERLTRENESTFLPTPSATQYGSNQGGAAGRTGKVRHSLESMAKHDLWPTPTAAQGGGDRTGARKGTGSLNYTVRKAHSQKTFPDTARGSLNPDWVEWLMGVPTGWTDLGSWETA